MSESLPLDLPAAHKHFSATCFNAAWELMEKPQRDPQENEQMLLLAFASFYHWTQRPDCTREARSVSLWQVSRVYVLLGQAENAHRYAELCRAESEASHLSPFYIGYAYEALARAAMLARNRENVNVYLAQAKKLCEKILDAEAKALLLADLGTIV